MSTINNLVTECALMLGNRADILSGNPSRMAVWVKNAYLEIAYATPFETLEGTLTSQTATGQPTINLDPSIRAPKCITYLNSAGAPVPMGYSDIKEIRAFNPSVPAPPAKWTLFNNLIYFGPIPDNNYNVIIDAWLKPVISVDIVSSVVSLPDDWLELVQLAAVMRGHVALLERDKAQAIQQLLYGFTDPSNGKRTPGLIQLKMTQRQALAPFVDYGMKPTSVRRPFTG